MLYDENKYQCVDLASNPIHKFIKRAKIETKKVYSHTEAGFGDLLDEEDIRSYLRTHAVGMIKLLHVGFLLILYKLYYSFELTTMSVECLLRRHEMNDTIIDHRRSLRENIVEAMKVKAKF